ncbi:unnamed protein product [Prunus armeniaca]|uniref:Uncharacterized protein n=1 Tax=Prunus armeniaca TaxID=36596 RepID=A0A6J5X596_PRUAR|nr:unnamed protein product [Prunus armeniaca]CAB4306239.1 unnamed protein product [Prunus armeniaca]
MSQDDVARHGGADGDTKLACRKVMWLAWVAWVFGEACGPFTRPLPFGKETTYEAFSMLCCAGHYLLPHRKVCAWSSLALFSALHRPSLTVVRGSSSIGHRVCSITLAERQGWLGSLFGGILCSFDLGPWSISKSEGREAQRQLHVGFVVSLFQCLTAKTSESFREKIFHGSYRSARLKVVGAFGIGKSRLWQQKVSARVVTALARGLLRFSKVKKWRFQPSVASAV